MVIIINISFSKINIFLLLEQIDEIDTKKKTTTTTGRKGKGPGSSKKQPTITENEELPVNDELKLSEDEEPVEDKSKTTTKKAPTKRSAPASGKKTTVASTKKKGQTDEPFEDQTNVEEIENNTDDG
jgi:hypothetical protein